MYVGCMYYSARTVELGLTLTLLLNRNNCSRSHAPPHETAHCGF